MRKKHLHRFTPRQLVDGMMFKPAKYQLLLTLKNTLKEPIFRTRPREKVCTVQVYVVIMALLAYLGSTPHLDESAVLSPVP